MLDVGGFLISFLDIPSNVNGMIYLILASSQKGAIVIKILAFL